RSALGLGAMALVVMTPLRKLVRPLLKKPGEGPTEAERDNGWFDCKLIVETESGEKYVFAMHGK
ncbi:MAG: saccharopine dehydrogenase, partial [Pseudomonadota bacterium]|nr:saccharopine dehydrogenase [Pseudomonadota bacterium]